MPGLFYYQKYLFQSRFDEIKKREARLKGVHLAFQNFIKKIGLEFDLFVRAHYLDPLEELFENIALCTKDAEADEKTREEFEALLSNNYGKYFCGQ